MALSEAEQGFWKDAADAGATEDQIADQIKARRASAAPATGAAETFSRGASSFVPFGKQAEAAFNTLPLVGTGKSYSDNLADVNARTTAGEAAHPVWSNLGKGTGLAASVLAPGGVPAQAALGALTAGGEANAQGKGPGDTLAAGGAGAALQGLAGPIAGKVASGAINTASKVIASPKTARVAASAILDSIPHVAAHALGAGGVGHSIANAVDIGMEAMHLPQAVAGEMSALIARAHVEDWPSSKLAKAIVGLSNKATQAAGTAAADEGP